MKFGVLQFFSWPRRNLPLADVYERALERIELMDQSGYDAVWLAEHHFTDYSVCPSVHMMGVHAAARTKRLRIGTAVSLAALYHPLRLAEEVALLDVLSGGRVNWGAGRGFDVTEFNGFGVPMDESAERFREAVEIVVSAWQNERLSFSGKHWVFDDIEVLPKPLQSPHPPVWLAASSTPAVEWAGEHGYSIMMDPHSHRRDIARKRDVYRARLEANGYSIEGRDLPMARFLAVAETAAAAEEVARRGAAWTVNAYANPKNTGHVDRGRAEDPVERYLDGVALHGTPEMLVDQLAELRETMCCDYLMCAPLSYRSFQLFTERVLPQLV